MKVFTQLGTLGVEMWSIELLICVGSSKYFEIFLQIFFQSLRLSFWSWTSLVLESFGSWSKGCRVKLCMSHLPWVFDSVYTAGRWLGGHAPPDAVTCRVPPCHDLAVTARMSGWGRGHSARWLRPPATSVDSPSLGLSLPESLTGNIVIMQNTSLPWPNYLAKTALKISFILHDPSNFFKTASFLYSWDFGDGYVLTHSPRRPQCLGPRWWPRCPTQGASYSPTFACSQSRHARSTCPVPNSGCMATRWRASHGTCLRGAW